MNINNPISDRRLHTNNTGQEDDHHGEEWTRNRTTHHARIKIHIKGSKF